VSRRRPLPHLVGAMRMMGGPGAAGLCVHRAAGFVIDTPGSALAFGTLIPDRQEGPRGPDDSDVPYIHAWPEWRGAAYAVSTIEKNGGLFSCPVEEYYRVNAVTDVHRLTRQQVLKIARAINLPGHLLRGEPTKASVGRSFLTAAGVRFRDDAGALLPLETTTEATTPKTMEAKPCHTKTTD
jgi:hypothetical protein